MVHEIRNDKNKLYPIFLKLEQMQVLLVGGGNVAFEKLGSLLSNSPQTKLTVVAPLINAEVSKLLQKHPACSIIQRSFEITDLDNKDIVVCATDNKELHKQIKQLANEKKLLVNVADTPELCDFYLGSIVQKGNLKIGISTNGKSPTIAKRIKEVLQESIPDEIDSLLQNMQEIRNKLTGDFSEKVKLLDELTKTLTK
ncbi:MAG: bifunctional precorrin-2 dehydrogenase/sirohydrochlorin ferrochelatase [Chitinophagaceae bacterium]